MCSKDKNKEASKVTRTRDEAVGIGVQIQMDTHGTNTNKVVTGRGNEMALLVAHPKYRDEKMVTIRTNYDQSFLHTIMAWPYVHACVYCSLGSQYAPFTSINTKRQQNDTSGWSWSANEFSERSSTRMSETSIASLQVGQDAPVLEVKVYEKWISRSFPDHKDLAAYSHKDSCVHNRFQKRRLPHCHTLIWVDHRSKIKDASQIDKYIYAELPDPTEETDTLNTSGHQIIHT